VPKVIGYMEGTNSEWLTTLGVLGFDTLPISNGYDGHGLNIQLISNQRCPDLILGYLHKVIPTPDLELTVKDLLGRTTMFEIPVLIVCPTELFDRAREKAVELPPNAMLVDPSQVLNEIKKRLA
jgi:hypothetical protein